jgi:hypothetical protein
VLVGVRVVDAVDSPLTLEKFTLGVAIVSVAVDTVVPPLKFWYLKIMLEVKYGDCAFTVNPLDGVVKLPSVGTFSTKGMRSLSRADIAPIG